MTGVPTVGFVGFGDLASAWAGELRGAGVPVTAFLPRDAQSRRSGLADARTGRSGIAPSEDLRAAVVGVDLVVAAVPATAALRVARECAPHLSAGSIYVDPSTASPDQKQRAADVVEESGATFADVAVLGTVTLSGLAVPLLASGSGAREFCDLAADLGMRARYAGPKAGDAARVKLVRSIYMKGRDALLVEMLAAARLCGIDEEQVIDSISSAPGEQVSFRELVDRVLPALVQHADRRADELAHVSDEVEGLGLSPIMSSAGEARLRWMASLDAVSDLRSRAEPPSAEEVQAALAAPPPNAG